MNAVDGPPQTMDALWRELRRARVDRRHPWRVMGLCTQGMEGPGVRQVVLRQVDEGERMVVAYTDARSAKVGEIAHCARVALLWWHPQKQWQLRAAAMASIASEGPEVDAHWAAVPPHARRDYASLSAPGTPMSGESTSVAASEAAARRHFRVMKLQLLQCEVLALGGTNPHLRLQWTWQTSGGWHREELVP